MIRRGLALGCLFAVTALMRGGEPLAVTGDDGVTLTLRTERPLRVISLAPALTELVARRPGPFYGPKYMELIGVSSYCNQPESAARLPKYGGPFDPDYERILAAKPDLVLAMSMMPKTVQDKLRGLGVPLLFFREPRTLLEIDALQQRLDSLFGAHCGRLTDGVVTGRECGPGIGAYDPDPNHRADRIARPVATCLILSAGQPLWTAGRETFLDDLLKVAGCRNAAAGYSGWSAIELERIATLKPDWIFFIGRPAPGGSPLDRLIRASKIRTLVLDEDMASRPGPRLFIILGIVETVLGTLPQNEGQGLRAKGQGSAPAPLPSTPGPRPSTLQPHAS